MSLMRILFIIRKEVNHILRDRRTLYLALGVPLVLLVLFGYALTMDVEHIALIVVDQDRTAESRKLTAAFENTGTFQVVDRPFSAERLTHRFHTGDAKAALIIPRGYAKSLSRGERADVQLIADGTNANDAAIIMGFGVAAAADMSSKTTMDALRRAGMVSGDTAKPPITVKSRNGYNPALRSQWYLVPGLISVILAMVNTLLMALTVAREWERGTMEQLLVTPVRRTEIVIGKLVPYFILGLVQLFLIATFGVILFDVPLKGDLAVLFGASVFALLAALGQGLLISIMVRNQQVAMQISILSSMLPAMLLSGFMSPIASMPLVIQKISMLVAARYYLIILRGVFLKGVDISVIRWEIAALAGFAAVLLIGGILRFKTRLD